VDVSGQCAAAHGQNAKLEASGNVPWHERGHWFGTDHQGWPQRHPTLADWASNTGSQIPRWTTVTTACR